MPETRKRTPAPIQSDYAGRSDPFSVICCVFVFASSSKRNCTLPRIEALRIYRVFVIPDLACHGYEAGLRVGDGFSGPLRAQLSECKNVLH